MAGDADWTKRGLDYEPPHIDTSKAHSARVYDYFLGGKDNYPPDREAAEQLLKAVPSARTSVRQNRMFLHRVTRYLAAEHGVDQFLDIGTGIPTSPNLHEIAQQVNPAARVVYLDDDPIVLAHAHARLTSSPQGQVAYIHADMRETEAVLAKPDLTTTLDLKRPVALFILSTLHLIPTQEETIDLLRRYMSALAPGSFLALSVSTNDHTPATGNQAQSVLKTHGIPVLARTKPQVEELFDGMEPIEPGVTLVHRWRPDAESEEVRASEVGLYCGVARKP
ncbi:SAM-dependent methyltransferase [Nonomuraea sp. NPDC050404]|uniref:SAM-dependent methyltransferase n=1 Tax=Nonomuraea sp. NPDC050404 TaxID=3155783 RepID=UPI0033EFA482